MSIDFDTPTNPAFVSLGALPPGQHWSRFDVPGKDAADGRANLLITSIWNFNWSRRGSTRVPTKPAVFRDSDSGTLWYRIGRPGPKAAPTSTAHWNRIALAWERTIPILGVLKDYSTSRCSLADTFNVVDVREDVHGDALWLQLRPARPLASEVSVVDIREVTGSGARKDVGTSRDSLTIESVIRSAVSAGGQAWLNDTVRRRLIERYAMAQAIAHFEKTWATVEDVSATESFDLRCRSDDRELRVEVKGTSTAGESVLLTRNEVKHAQSPNHNVALFVVSGIIVSSDNKCSGGILTVIDPWQLEHKRLSPVTYEYRLRG